MIRALIESAFQTGCLSVESEGLLHQVLATKSYDSKDLAALAALDEAVRAGQIKREASSSSLLMKFTTQYKRS
ncbi:hypothetical protein NIES4075_60550 [Tolypothrix sp. NIES-4075]|uniref:hypothetical protein n=1 Tax=Tolypothrix sp. NIES-4075 TaxID=2005459 RepID=UPI000B5C1F3A|nr:hypothetical protein [Tolypothrix sp. NIES-4075]GAX45036.1 hypothetical protein NIES4075_60550 [Tolypothrix sp. NIES-4075]